MPRRALVTGANGFIGQHIARRLADDGWEVVRGVRTAPLPVPSGTLALGSNQWDLACLTAALADVAPDTVFHFAGLSSAEQPVDLYATNVMLTARLLEAAASQRLPPAVVLAGSAAEYGIVSEVCQPTAEDTPCAPVTHYGISKYAQTMLGLAWARNGLRVLVARIFNPIGKGMPGHLALASFAAQIREGANVLRVGNLDVCRDFLDVAEAARLIVALASREGSYGQTVNICSGVASPLRPLVDALIQHSGRAVQLEVMADRLRPGEMRSFRGDTTRLRAAGLQPAPPDFNALLTEL